MQETKKTYDEVDFALETTKAIAKGVARGKIKSNSAFKRLAGNIEKANNNDEVFKLLGEAMFKNESVSSVEKHCKIAD